MSNKKEATKWDKNGNIIKMEYINKISPYRSTIVKEKLTKYIDEY